MSVWNKRNHDKAHCWYKNCLSNRNDLRQSLILINKHLHFFYIIYSINVNAEVNQMEVKTTVMPTTNVHQTTYILTRKIILVWYKSYDKKLRLYNTAQHQFYGKKSAPLFHI